MLPRVLETEAMDTLTEAVDYDLMDHREVNARFVDDVLALGPPASPVLDLGTGTAQIPIELCRRAEHVTVVAADLARHMLRVAAANIVRARLAARIVLHRVDAKSLPYPDGGFPMVVSNSIVHHIAEPLGVLAEAWRVLAPGGWIFFRDLYRPPHESTLRHLVETYAAGANEHQQQMFADSFRAALTVAEMQHLVGRLGVGPETVRMTSDRHWTWAATKPKTGTS